MADLQIMNEGTIVRFRAVSPAGEDFLALCDFEDWQMFGGTYCVDHRPAHHLMALAFDAGLDLEEA